MKGWACAVAFASAAAAGLGAQSVLLHAMQTGAGMPVHSAVLADTDGDGREDLVVIVGGDRRSVRVHRATGAEAAEHGRFVSRPTHVVPLPRSVAAFAVADLLSTAGREIILVGAQTLAAVTLSETDKPQIVALHRGETLWQSPVPDRVMSWQVGVVDVDRDGRDELLVPSLTGYRRLAMPGDEVLVQEFPLPEPIDARTVPGQVELELAIGVQGGRANPALLDADHEIPSPQWIDFDGDGDLDLVALVNATLCVWMHDAAWQHPGTIEAAVQFSQPYLQRPLGDPCYSVQLADLDADGRADLVWTRSRSTGDGPSTMVNVHLQRDDFEQRHDRLRFRGLGVVTQLLDLDDDRRPELLVGALQTDLTDLINGSASMQVVVSIAQNGFSGPRPRFRRPLAMNYSCDLPASVMRPSRSRTSMLLRLPAGGLALMLRSEATELSLQPIRADGDGYALGAVSWRGKIHAEGIVVAAGEASFLVLEPEQVLVGVPR